MRPGIISVLFPISLLIWVSRVAQVVKNLPSNVGDAGDWASILGSGGSPGGGNGWLNI